MFIGVDFSVCTMKHYIESRMVVRLLSLLYSEEERLAFRAELSKGCKHVLWPFMNGPHMEEVLSLYGVVKKTTLGSATLRAVRTRPLVEILGQDIWQHPETWFAEDFLRWRERIQKQGAGNCPGKDD